jgi:hypothetical protein
MDQQALEKLKKESELDLVPTKDVTKKQKKQ